MRPEDLEKLFSDFVQVDTKKNRGIEGTGLGLAITQRLCQAMGGDISVESEYGKGSVFTVHIPQDINSVYTFAAVEDAANKKVLVYEGRAVYAKSVCWSLQNMGVPYTMTGTLEEFTEALLREEWYYIFSGHGLYERIRPAMDGDESSFPGGKKPPLALMVECGTEANTLNVRFVSLPIQSLSIANVLNGKADIKNFVNSSAIIRFSIPHARLLVVDDIATNLKVAEGLLAPYHATVDTSLSGIQAIEMVKRHHYDLVFMDHMMPEMDGIEATVAIRDWEAELEGQGIVRFTVPIIALTANAVVGMREMFIQKGFSDFLAKPIDISKLDEILDRWIPKEKKEIGSRDLGVGSKSEDNNAFKLNSANSNYDLHSPLPVSSSSLTIPGVDIQKGISLTGGTMAFYRKVLHSFCKDIQERLAILQCSPDTSNLLGFVTQVHALKSASASIGAAEVSTRAAEREAAGKAVDLIFIFYNLPVFAERLAELIDGIQVWENAADKDDASNREYDYETVAKLFNKLAAALEVENAGDIDRILEELNDQALDAETKEALEKISDNVLMTEFGKAAEIVRSLQK
jgi:CheY-like chemotaxis protein/HPt (histidine-containing phosphotransfer) domain-containing protein